MWSDEIEPTLQSSLVEAYMLRQAWLAELQAGMIVKRLAAALEGTGRDQQIAPNELLAQMGVEISGYGSETG